MDMLRAIARKMLHKTRFHLGLDEVFKEVKSRNMLLSPVDQFLFCHHKYFGSGHFHWHYQEWRMKRIRKILEIYGIDFKGKKVLELGGGIGEIGAFFAELGADVLSLEGRACNRNYANLKYRNSGKFLSIARDLEKDFSDLGRFDLVINFGMTEVIQNVTNLLDCCMELSDEIVLETMVCDSSDPNKIVFVQMNPEAIDNPLAKTGRGARPSPVYIEDYFAKNDFSVTRYFTNDLNTAYHTYDWIAKNDGSAVDSMRRFWRFKKK